MKILRILPGAAGIIALTATIGFIDGQREIEDENISRGRIALAEPIARTADGELPGNHVDIKSGNPVYLVEIRRGNIFKEVKIDAVTGRIISS
jgi:uncharacterized membrane protein YkoI